MVQLNTTYDKTLKSKIFVLKGEEGYARTTDVIASLISDYKDCNNKKQYARVGLEVEVLREVGDGFLYIYDNDEPLMENIPWSADNMATIISDGSGTPTSWNQKGIYWIDGKLIIGEDVDDDESYGNTGFNLGYDVEHNIRVKYSGNKSCLGSVSDTLDFYMETPSTYDSIITLSCPNTGKRYDTGASINNITVTYHSAMHTLTKKLRIYVDGTQYGDDITVTDNTASTLTLGTMSDGKHTISAEFLGDDESAYAKESIDISVGYKITPTDYPVSALGGTSYNVKCKVTDYLDAPVSGANVVGVYYVSGWGYEQCSQTAITNEDGIATLPQYTFNTGYPNKINYNDDTYNYYSDELPTTVIDITSITFTAPSPQIYGIGNQQTITGSINQNVKQIPVTIVEESNQTTVYTDDNGGFSYPVTMTGKGSRTIRASCNNIYTDATFEDVIHYWDVGTLIINDRFRTSNNTIKVNNGYRISEEGYFSITTPSYYYNWDFNKRFELSFDIVAKSNPYYEISPDLSIDVNNGGYSEFTSYPLNFYNLKSGDTVKIKFYPNANTMVSYVNGTVAQTVDYDKNLLAIMLHCPHNGSITINKLKTKGW